MNSSTLGALPDVRADSIERFSESVERPELAPAARTALAGAQRGSAQAVLVEPPHTNRGVCLTVSVHWLRGTNPGIDYPFADAVAFLTDFLGKADPVPSGWNGYNESHVFPTGCRLMVNRLRPEMGWCFEAKGEACEQLGFEQLQFIYYGLQLRGRRVDLAVDGCGFTPFQLYGHWLADEVRSNCRPLNPKHHENIRSDMRGVRAHTWNSSPTGDTLQMGSRHSTVVARCYDSRSTGTRFELELKEERAELSARLVFDHADQLPQVVIGLIQDFVDFVDVESDTNRSRCVLLPFWGAFVEDCARLTVYLEPRPDVSLQRVVDWVEGQVAKTLAMYELYTSRLDNNEDARYKLYHLGLGRLTCEDVRLLQAAGINIDRALAAHAAVATVARYAA